MRRLNSQAPGREPRAATEGLAFPSAGNDPARVRLTAAVEDTTERRLASRTLRRRLRLSWVPPVADDPPGRHRLGGGGKRFERRAPEERFRVYLCSMEVPETWSGSRKGS